MRERSKRLLKVAIFVLALGPIVDLMVRASGAWGTQLGADPVRTLTDALGLWGLRFLLLTLCCTPLRYALGSSTPLRYRRMLGLFSFFYLFLHMSAYVLLDLHLDVTQLAHEIVKRTWIALGLASFTILLALAITSNRWAMRRLKAWWQQLHYGIYLAAILGVWHWYGQVKRDVREPLIYAAVLAALLLVRLGRQAWRAYAARLPQPE